MKRTICAVIILTFMYWLLNHGGYAPVSHSKLNHEPTSGFADDAADSRRTDNTTKLWVSWMKDEGARVQQWEEYFSKETHGYFDPQRSPLCVPGGTSQCATVTTIKTTLQRIVFVGDKFLMKVYESMKQSSHDTLFELIFIEAYGRSFPAAMQRVATMLHRDTDVLVISIGGEYHSYLPDEAKPGPDATHKDILQKLYIEAVGIFSTDVFEDRNVIMMSELYSDIKAGLKILGDAGKSGVRIVWGTPPPKFQRLRGKRDTEPEEERYRLLQSRALSRGDKQSTEMLTTCFNTAKGNYVSTAREVAVAYALDSNVLMIDQVSDFSSYLRSVPPTTNLFPTAGTVSSPSRCSIPEHPETYSVLGNMVLNSIFQLPSTKPADIYFPLSLNSTPETVSWPTLSTPPEKPSMRYGTWMINNAERFVSAGANSKWYEDTPLCRPRWTVENEKFGVGNFTEHLAYVGLNMTEELEKNLSNQINNFVPCERLMKAEGCVSTIREFFEGVANGTSAWLFGDSQIELVFIRYRMEAISQNLTSHAEPRHHLLSLSLPLTDGVKLVWLRFVSSRTRSLPYNMKTMLPHIKDGDIILSHLGVHYNTWSSALVKKADDRDEMDSAAARRIPSWFPEEFRPLFTKLSADAWLVMERFRNHLRDNPNKKIAFVWGTSKPQYFPTPTGIFGWEMGVNSGGCSNNTHNIPPLREIAIAYGLAPHLDVIDAVVDISSAVRSVPYDGPMMVKRNSDCTHFCMDVNQYAGRMYLRGLIEASALKN